MKVIEAIKEADNLKPNMYGTEVKIKWLSRLDQRIFQTIIRNYILSDEEAERFLPDGETLPEPPDLTGFRALDLPFPPPPDMRPHLVFNGYTENDQDAELIVKEPYDEMYVHWLEAQIDWNNREIDGFNSANAMFESVYQNFRNAFNRSHQALGTAKRYF